MWLSIGFIKNAKIRVGGKHRKRESIGIEKRKEKKSWNVLMLWRWHRWRSAFERRRALCAFAHNNQLSHCDNQQILFLFCFRPLIYLFAVCLLLTVFFINRSSFRVSLFLFLLFRLTSDKREHKIINRFKLIASQQRQKNPFFLLLTLFWLIPNKCARAQWWQPHQLLKYYIFFSRPNVRWCKRKTTRKHENIETFTRYIHRPPPPPSPSRDRWHLNRSVFRVKKERRKAKQTANSQ